MTSKDFVFLAGVMANREKEIEELDVPTAERLGCRFAHRRTVMQLSDELSKLYPRFKRGVFEYAALPIYHEARHKEIVASLNRSATRSH